MIRVDTAADNATDLRYKARAANEKHVHFADASAPAAAGTWAKRGVEAVRRVIAGLAAGAATSRQSVDFRNAKASGGRSPIDELLYVWQ